MVKYSICMTNYNTVNVIKASLESILARMDGEDFEIVIVDNKSSDGSREILEEYQSRHRNIVLIHKKCLRGKGRQIAFNHSSGAIIITADCDTAYNDAWRKVISYYADNRLEYGLSMVYSQIYQRKLLEEVGGWNNLQFWEDAELWARLACMKLYRTYPVISGENIKQNPSRTPIERFYRLYRKMHDRLLLFTEIPFRYYVRGYHKHIEDNDKTIKGWFRLLLYYACLFPAFITSAIRNRLYSYGDLSCLRRDDIVIDLGIVAGEKLQIQKSAYDTEESIVKAFKNGDLNFLPGFYD